MSDSPSSASLDQQNVSLDKGANGTANATSPITPEGVIIAYTGLYTMAMICICYGSYLSAKLVRQHRAEKKHMENSITFKDAKWFPITASCVLFGLYCIFRRKECLGFVLQLFRQYLQIRLPQNIGSKVENFLVIASSNSSSNSTNNNTLLNNSTLLSSDQKINSTMIHDFLDMFTKENVSHYLLIFFCMEGVFALAHLLKPVLVGLVRRFTPKMIGDKLLGEQLFHYRMSFTRSPLNKVDHNDVKEDADEKDEPRKQFFDCTFDSHDLFCVAVCSIIGICHVLNRNWLSNNAFGLAFTLYGIEALHLSSFKGGAVLLAGLFVYDIFWVFATDVMSTVATTVNAPILLMFPQDLLVNGLGSSTKFAMLGLGDIVIPGIFLALLLRFGEKYKKKSYFYVTVGAYAGGLMLTIFVMHYFKAAQPALLYLVPACLGTPTLLAACRGDFKLLWLYDEVDLVKPEKPETKTVNKKKTKKDQ